MFCNFIIRGATRRPLTGKHGNKNYYKGTGSGSMGFFTKKGHFIPVEAKRRIFVAPSLEGCKVIFD